MKRFGTLTAAIVAMAAFATATQAAIIVQYGFNSPGGDTTSATTANGVTASTVTNVGHSGVNYSTSAITGSDTGSTTRRAQGMNTFSTNDDNSRYWQFTITPDAGSVTISEFYFFFDRLANNSADEWWLRSDATGGFSNGDNIDGTYTSSAAGSPTKTSNKSKASGAVGNLGITSSDARAGLIFDTPLTISSATTFRFYTVSAGGSGSGIDIDDITLVEIPEPASLALIGIGSLMMARRRRA